MFVDGDVTILWSRNNLREAEKELGNCRFSGAGGANEEGLIFGGEKEGEGGETWPCRGIRIVVVGERLCGGQVSQCIWKGRF